MCEYRIVNCCTFCVPETICGRYEKQLLRDLMVDYDPLERPVINESSSIMVTFGITLQQIIDVVSPPFQQHTYRHFTTKKTTKRQLKRHYTSEKAKHFRWILHEIVNRVA